MKPSLLTAMGLFASAVPAVAVASVQVESTGAGTYRLTWSDWARGTPVDVYVTDRPDSGPRTWRRLVNDDRDGQAVVSIKATSRPYFYVAPDRRRGRWVAERLLPLEGGINFRDLGGYRTRDGHSVRWGKLFRSGAMAGLTTRDYAYLGQLGIRWVCDLRTEQERRAAPNKWAAAAHVRYYTRDYETSGGELGRLLTGRVAAAQVREAMIKAYREMPYEQAPAYREMFRQLAAGDVPLAFNCTAGKDRTGLAAALILTALGVPRETVFADYRLTDRYLRPALARGNGGDDPIAKMPRDLVEPLLAADPDYLRAAFATIDQRNGSVENYLRDVLGVHASDLQRIRRALLD